MTAGSRQPGAPPEGYLGTTARITSGPAPELVEAGYALEIGDAPLAAPRADPGRPGSPGRAGRVRRADARTRRRRCAPCCSSCSTRPPPTFPYDPVYGDAYNSRERELERALGPAAGRLHLGRTRREAGRIAFRLALRDKLLGLHADVAAFAAADRGPGRQARGHAVGRHHLPAARPAVHVRSLPGWLRRAGGAPPGPDRGRLRPRGRLARGGRRGGRHPAADGRDRLARRLGFGSVGPHTRDAMWSADAWPTRSPPRPRPWRPSASWPATWRSSPAPRSAT